jgi:hypothetical protein
MNKIMTVMEIKTHFKSEWILIEEPEVSLDLEVTGGKVLWHSKDRDEVYRKARELKPQHSAILYTGSLPKGTDVIL